MRLRASAVPGAGFEGSVRLSLESPTCAAVARGLNTSRFSAAYGLPGRRYRTFSVSRLLQDANTSASKSTTPRARIRALRMKLMFSKDALRQDWTLHQEAMQGACC